ncbi:MAG: hypothetical protein EU541_04110 [Promethearchaeota archaeon]|nr:MAG: hypothetical protein EU541_04110 [Candidatus Lokiarchaeota archaeon]
MGEKGNQNKKNNEKPYFEDIIKKTKTGLTIPKQLRDDLFEEDKDYFFKLTVPSEKDKFILEILTESEAEELTQKLKSREKENKQTTKKEKSQKKQSNKPSTKQSKEISWGEIFIYDFDAKNKVQPILESAFEKFTEEPINFDDAMGRVKYALVSYLSASKSENAKLYYAIIKFMIKIINQFDQPDLIDWLYQKVVPHIDSKFIYQLALIDLIETSLKNGKEDQAEIYLKKILEDINDYPLSELYNIMSSFGQLVKKLKAFDSLEMFNLIRNDLLKYNERIETIDYKIQIIEMLEDLDFIEQAYSFADNLLKELHPESVKIADVRKIKKRLGNKPL